jgi:hypothetical protein
VRAAWGRETLGDLAFYFRRYGTIDGIKAGVVSPESNILGAWIEAAEALPATDYGCSSRSGEVACADIARWYVSFLDDG